jgi:hypothetical protein
VKVQIYPFEKNSHVRYGEGWERRKFPAKPVTPLPIPAGPYAPTICGEQLGEDAADKMACAIYMIYLLDSWAASRGGRAGIDINKDRMR